MRALRYAVEQGIGETIPDKAHIMSWMEMWVAKLIAKYSPRDDGRIPFEGIKLESCAVPSVPFGETVMHLPLQTATSSKGIPAKKQGVWLGTIKRTEESITGTTLGIVKCSIASRLSPTGR